MKKVLNKRIGRELKSNIWRYSALLILLAVAIYMIISIVGSAEVVQYKIGMYSEQNNIEDGEFTVFEKLTEKEIASYTNKGILIEEQFYLDFEVENHSRMRIFRNRESINLIEIVQGNMAINNNEVVLEKNYGKSHKLKIGDKIKIAGYDYLITGFGTVPDYDLVTQDLTDISADAKNFGVGFINKMEYNELVNSNKSISAATYSYSYRLNNNMTENELRELLSEAVINSKDVKDIYFQEIPIIAELEDKRINIDSRVKELNNGISNLNDGIQNAITNGMPLEEVGDGGKKLQDGIEILSSQVEKLKEEFLTSNVSNLVELTSRESNARIGASLKEVSTNKYAGIIAGIIVLVLIAYVISVFIIRLVQQESSIIGALYAMGVKRSEIIKHYLVLPALVSVGGGICGTILGFSKIGVNRELLSITSYYSVPEMIMIYPIYLIIYGVAVPPIIVLIVNYIIMNKELKKTALALLRKENKQKNVFRPEFKNLGFLQSFQIRQLLRDFSSNIIMFGGIFLSLLILILGLNCYSICYNISVNNKNHTNFDYMYLLKYPLPEMTEQGEKAYAKKLSKEKYGNNINVTMLGIFPDSSFFDYKLPKQANEILISSSVAQKYDLKNGHEITLNDEENNKKYTFDIVDIVDYSIGLYVFMDLEIMQDFFGKEDYYNVVFSNKKLDIDAGRLYGTTTREDIADTSDIFMKQYSGLIISMISSSIAMFIIVMYLLMRVMLEKSKNGISLIRIFGYKQKEVKKLYLRGNFYFVCLATLACIPVAKIIMNKISPILCSNFICGVDSSFQPWIYVCIYFGVILCYLILEKILVIEMKKYTPEIVLKNRE